MKEPLLVFSTSCLTIFNCFSQGEAIEVKKQETIVVLYIGTVIPVGNSFSDEFNNSLASFAEPGAILEISFAYNFNSFFFNVKWDQLVLIYSTIS